MTRRCSRRYSGRDLAGWTYQPPFDYVVHRGRALRRPGRLRHHRGRHRAGPPGAGVRCRRHGDRPEHTACPWSTRSAATGDSAATSRIVGGMFFKDADEVLVADLQARGLLFRHVPYAHSYPHCWRCHTPLMYYALPSWYVRTTAIKDELLAENEATNWYPATIKHGRYGDWLENNIDWALSRDRYWGTPLPDLAQRRRPQPGGLRRLARRVVRTRRSRRGGPRPAPAVRRRRHVYRAGRGRHVPPGAAGHRRLVRLRLDAVRPVRRAVPQRRRDSARATRPTSSARRSTRPAAGSTR